MSKRIKKKSDSGKFLSNPFAEKKRKLVEPEDFTVAPPVGSQNEGLDGDKISEKEPNFNIFAGTSIGILKGISIGRELPMSKSIYKPTGLKTKPPAVVSLAWTDVTEKDLLVCFSNQLVKTYNPKLRAFTRQVLLDTGSEDDNVVGLFSMNLNGSNYVYGLETGAVGVWNCRKGSTTLSFKTCKPHNDPKLMPDLRQLCQCPSDPSIFATGGKENDLKIWNLAGEKPEEAIFKAKNLPHDWLELRVPIWAQDLAFLPRTSEVVAVATRYGQVRLYDVRSGQRPVSNVQFCDHPVMAISSTLNDRQVVVGTAQGEAGLYDLRNPGKEKLLLKYHGFSGSIRKMVASPEQPYMVSSGLDRHLYIHKLSQKTPVKKLYLNQPISSIVITKSLMKEWDERAEKMEGDWANIPPEVLDVMPVVAATEVTKAKIKAGDS